MSGRVRRWARADWTGTELVPRGGALLVANAGSLPWWDATVVAEGIESSTGRRLRWMAEGADRSPLLGLGPRMGPPDAGEPHRLLHDVQELILTLVEPEPEPATDDRPMLPGTVELAMRAGVPVVPIALVGTDDAAPMLLRCGRGHRLTANQVLLGPVLGRLVPLPVKYLGQVLPPIRFDAEAHEDHYAPDQVAAGATLVYRRLRDARLALASRRDNVWLG